MRHKDSPQPLDFIMDILYLITEVLKAGEELILSLHTAPADVVVTRIAVVPGSLCISERFVILWAKSFLDDIETSWTCFMTRSFTKKNDFDPFLEALNQRTT